MRRALPVILSLLAACHGGPAIDSFTADKSTVYSGDLVTFTWKVSGATRLSIDPDVGDVSGTTSALAHPFATATYTLTATGSSGTSKAKVNITVKPTAGVATFVATPPQIAPGDPVTLRWSVAGVDSVSITGLGSQPPAGTATVTGLQKTTRYTLTASTLAAPLNLLVRVAPAPVITSFTGPETAPQGSDVTLSWTATNATSFQLESDTGPARFLGPLTSVTLQQSATTRYTLTASGPTGRALQGKTVTVASTPGTTFLYTQPPSGAEVVQLVADPCPQPCLLLTLSLVVVKPVAADALALDLPVPGAVRVALHQSAGAPDWQVNPNGDALDPGSGPAAAALALPLYGPLARVLTLGIALKPPGNGAVAAPRQLQPGAVLARFRLDLLPANGTGLVFSRTQAEAPSFVLRAAGVPQGSLAIGELRVQ